jgi:hypothetical protein
MDIMRRRMLQLVGMGAVTIASPRLSSALDAETGGRSGQRWDQPAPRKNRAAPAPAAPPRLARLSIRAQSRAMVLIAGTLTLINADGYLVPARKSPPAGWAKFD